MARFPAGHPGAIEEAQPSASVVCFARARPLALGQVSRCQGPVVGRGRRQGKEIAVSLSASYPHRIRLRGPWDCEPLHGPAPRRVVMPCCWSDADLADFHGLARFTRKFGYPGRVDDSEHVWLTCAGVTGCTEVRLNGQLLTSDPCTTFAFDVTPILRER